MYFLLISGGLSPKIGFWNGICPRGKGFWPCALHPRHCKSQEHFIFIIVLFFYFLGSINCFILLFRFYNSDLLLCGTWMKLFLILFYFDKSFIWNKRIVRYITGFLSKGCLPAQTSLVWAGVTNATSITVFIGHPIKQNGHSHPLSFVPFWPV